MDGHLYHLQNLTDFNKKSGRVIAMIAKLLLRAKGAGGVAISNFKIYDLFTRLNPLG